MNLTPNYNAEDSNSPGERVNSNSQSQNNNLFLKRILKNNFIFYGLMCSISLFFLIFSRDLVKKNFIYQENQKYRVLEQKEEDKKNTILRILQPENNFIESDYTLEENDKNSITKNNFLQKVSESDSSVSFPRFPVISAAKSSNPENPSNTLMILSNYTNTIQNLTQELHKLLDIKTSDEIAEINRFFNSLNYLTYTGKWVAKNSKTLFDNTTTGDMIFKMERLNDRAYDSQTTLYGLKLLKGKYIDEWISFKGLLRSYSNITMTQNSIKISYPSFAESGEIFDRINEIPYCTGEFNLEFSKKNILKLSAEDKYKYSSLLDTSSSLGYSTNLKDEFIDKIKGSFKSSCDVDIEFDIEFSDDREIYKQVTLYSIFLSIFVSMQILNNVHLVKKIGESVTLSNSICLFTIGQSIIWNSYGCLCHFFLTINFEIYYYHFGVPTFLFFINFTIFELRLIYHVWKMQNLRNLTNAQMIRKRLLRFYLTFYCFMFASLFFVMKFYFDKKYIFLAVGLTWTPQIIYNAYYKNNISMPIISIIMISLNRIFLPFYYRGFPDNFFKISHDYTFILATLFFLIIFICIMYSQSVKGPRWFLPARCKGLVFNFYKSKEEILVIKPDAEFHECVICLHNLFNIDMPRVQDEDFLQYPPRRDSIKEKLFEFYKNYKSNIFDFHNASANTSKKPFMITPCVHIFHTPCLESWISQKKECPCCRKEIEDI